LFLLNLNLNHRVIIILDFFFKLFVFKN